jgi:hypothetical protein
MDFPEPEPIESPHFDPAPERIMKQEETPAPPPEPVATAELAEVQPDAVSMNVVRNSMPANFEQDNLDVPAFLRKRTEIM